MGDYQDFHQEPAIRSGRTRTMMYFIAGALLIVLGLVGIGVYALMPTNTPVEGDGTADGAWQSTIIIAAAVSGGAGVLLVLLGFVAIARRNRRTSA